MEKNAAGYIKAIDECAGAGVEGVIETSIEEMQQIRKIIRESEDQVEACCKIFEYGVRRGMRK